LENYFKALQYENTYKIEKGRLQGKIKLKSAILALPMP
jgi:hypothetical protein